MRVFFFLLPPLVATCMIVNENALWKEKQNVKEAEHLLKGLKKLQKAKQNVEQYCAPANDFSFSMICHEVVENQLFPVPVQNDIVVLRLVLDTFYKHKEEIIAYFSRNKKLILPKKPINVTIMRELQKKYNI